MTSMGTKVFLDTIFYDILKYSRLELPKFLTDAGIVDTELNLNFETNEVLFTGPSKSQISYNGKLYTNINNDLVLMSIIEHYMDNELIFPFKYDRFYNALSILISHTDNEKLIEKEGVEN